MNAGEFAHQPTFNFTHIKFNKSVSKPLIIRPHFAKIQSEIYIYTQQYTQMALRMMI